jgi:predicted DNA-binding transcriptional regulator AlpA
MARINQELFERQLIVIQHCRMRRLSRAAIQEMLGISRATYYRRMAVTKKRQSTFSSKQRNGSEFMKNTTLNCSAPCRLPASEIVAIALSHSHWFR